jgi:hypothetical protein
MSHSSPTLSLAKASFMNIDDNFFTALRDDVPCEEVVLGPHTYTVTQQVFDAARASIRSFHNACNGALRAYKLRGAEKSELQAILGEAGATERLLTANRRVRRAATYILAGLLRDHRLASFAFPKRRHWHVSFLGPLVNEYEPRLDIEAYGRSVYRLLHKAKLNAVFAVELQPLTNYPQRGHGRSFLVNAHALCWTDDPAFDAESAEDAMNESKSIKSVFGAPLVVFKERTLTAGSVEYSAYYLFKAPFVGKYRTRDPDVPTRWIFNEDHHVRPQFLLRLAEVLSLIEFTDLAWGVRAGKTVRRDWKKGLTHWNEVQCARPTYPLETGFDTAELWERIRARQENGSRRYSPIALFGPQPKPLANQAEARARGPRIRPSAPPPRGWSLNQRVLGSSPSASTIPFSDLD